MKTTRQGKPLNYNVAIQLRYERALKQIVDRMVNSTNKEIKALFQQKSVKIYFKHAQDAKKTKTLSTRAKLALAALLLKFQTLFNSSSRKLAQKFIDDTNRYASTTVKNSLEALTGEKFNTSIISKIGRIRIQAVLNSNIALIKSIPQQYFTQISIAIMEAIATGLTRNLENLIRKHGDVTQRRAKMIVADQTHKAFQAIAMQKILDHGFKKFQWVYTFRSKEPRPKHVAMGGKIYSFDKPPEGVFPGQLINCKCVMRPVAEWEK